jgi:hypothetical protein
MGKGTTHERRMGNEDYTRETYGGWGLHMRDVWGMRATHERRMRNGDYTERRMRMEIT